MSGYMRSWESIMKLTSMSPPARRCAISKARLCMSERPRDEEQKRAEKAEHQRRADEPRHAKHAHLGGCGLEKCQQRRADAKLRGVSGNGGPVNPRRAFRPDQTEG